MTTRKNWLEWTVFALGLALVLAVVGVLVAQALRHDDAPPILGVLVDEPRRPEGAHPPHFVVPITVTNDGDRAAEWVLVELTLVQGDRVLERSELRVPDLPRRSRRSAAFILQHDPQSGALRTRVLGYSEP